jgi:hypothetical protein
LFLDRKSFQSAVGKFRFEHEVRIGFEETANQQVRVALESEDLKLDRKNQLTRDFEDNAKTVGASLTGRAV